MTAIRGPILLSMGLHGLFAVVLAVAPLGAKAVLEPRQEITIDLIEPLRLLPRLSLLTPLSGRNYLRQSFATLSNGTRAPRISVRERFILGDWRVWLMPIPKRLLVLAGIRLWFLLPGRWRRQSNRCQVLSRCRGPFILSARWRSCQMAKA